MENIFAVLIPLPLSTVSKILSPRVESSLVMRSLLSRNPSVFRSDLLTAQVQLNSSSTLMILWGLLGGEGRSRSDTFLARPHLRPLLSLISSSDSKPFILLQPNFAVFKCRHKRSPYGNATSQHVGHGYTSDWLQYCRNGTKARGGGIYADSDSYHYPSSHSPTSTAQLHQASLMNSTYATQGMATGTPTHHATLAHASPIQNFYVQSCLSKH